MKTYSVMNGITAKRFVHQLIDAEFTSDCDFVRRIPSTHTWRSLAYVDTLDADERDALFELFSERGGAALEPRDCDRDYDRHTESTRHPAYQRFLEAMTQHCTWTYADPSCVREILDLQCEFPDDFTKK